MAPAIEEYRKRALGRETRVQGAEHKVVNISEVREFSACLGWMAEEGAQMSLMTNEVQTSKHLELSESKKNVFPVINFNIVNYSASFNTANFYNAFPANVFETLNWQNESC